MLGIVSSCAIVTLSLRCTIFPIFDFKNAVLCSVIRSSIAAPHTHWNSKQIVYRTLFLYCKALHHLPTHGLILLTLLQISGFFCVLPAHFSKAIPVQQITPKDPKEPLWRLLSVGRFLHANQLCQKAVSPWHFAKKIVGNDMEVSSKL